MGKLYHLFILSFDVKKLDILFLAWITVVLMIGIGVHLNQSPDAELLVNPKYDEFVVLGQALGIDTAFTEKLKPGWEFRPEDIGVLEDSNTRYDVMIIGDSSVAFGISPAITSSISRKNIGVFSFPAMAVTKNLMTFTNNLSKNKLNENGEIIMMFDPKFWLKGYTGKQESPALEQLILSHSFENCVYCQSGLKQYEQSKEAFFHQKTISSYFTLPELDFYSQVIEPVIAPKINQKKRLNQQGHKRDEKRFFIEKNHVLIVKEETNKILRPHQGITGKPKYISRLKQFMTDLKQANLSITVVLPLTYDLKIYQQMCDVTASLGNAVHVIDLNQSLPDGWEIEMQNRTHMANTGIIKQSYLLGQSLRSD